MSKGTLFLYTETPTHVGTGTGLGTVDMPIQREAASHFPMIQGSGVKGALRSQYPGNDDPNNAEYGNRRAVFGPMNQPDHAGAAIFGDAHILAFPVRSLRGVFAWTTCLEVLARFRRDCTLPNIPELSTAPPTTRDTASAYVASDRVLVDQTRLILEEFDYNAQVTALAREWAIWLADHALPQTAAYAPYRAAFIERFVVLPDDEFRDFTLYATAVVTRISIDPKTHIVKNTGLFTQELLPADSLLYIPVLTHKPRVSNSNLAGTVFQASNTEARVLQWLRDNAPPSIQIGGDETIGYGAAALRWGE